MTKRPKAESPSAAVTFAIGEFEWRQDRSQYTSAEDFIGFLRERGYDVVPREAATFLQGMASHTTDEIDDLDPDDALDTLRNWVAASHQWGESDDDAYEAEFDSRPVRPGGDPDD